MAEALGPLALRGVVSLPATRVPLVDVGLGVWKADESHTFPYTLETHPSSINVSAILRGQNGSC